MRRTTCEKGGARGVLSSVRRSGCVSLSLATLGSASKSNGDAEAARRGANSLRSLLTLRTSSPPYSAQVLQYILRLRTHPTRKAAPTQSAYRSQPASQPYRGSPGSGGPPRRNRARGVVARFLASCRERQVSERQGKGGRRRTSWLARLLRLSSLRLALRVRKRSDWVSGREEKRAHQFVREESRCPGGSTCGAERSARDRSGWSKPTHISRMTPFSGLLLRTRLR